jgi:hypothetical protein
MIASMPEPIDVEEASGTPPRVWTMRFSPNDLTFTSDGLPSRVVRYADRFVDITRTKHMFLHAGASPLAFKSTPEVRARLDAWIGPPTREHLRVRIRKIVSQAVLTGGGLVFWAFLSEAPNGPALVLGLPLLMVGGLSYVVVHRALFAAMAIVYAVNVIALVAFVMTGASPWLLLLAVLITLSASVQAREYRSFEGVPDRDP